MTTESPIDILRKMPADRAAVIARGIAGMLAWRPDLRRLYSPADLAFIQHLTGTETPIRYAKAGDQEGGEALAIEHARALNDALDAGQPVTVPMLDAIAEELEPTGWRIDYSKQAWRAVAPAKKRTSSIPGILVDLKRLEKERARTVATSASAEGP